jgi:hypothetical protein
MQSYVSNIITSFNGANTDAMFLFFNGGMGNVLLARNKAIRRYETSPASLGTNVVFSNHSAGFGYLGFLASDTTTYPTLLGFNK